MELPFILVLELNLKKITCLNHKSVAALRNSLFEVKYWFKVLRNMIIPEKALANLSAMTVVDLFQLLPP